MARNTKLPELDRRRNAVLTGGEPMPRSVVVASLALFLCALVMIVVFGSLG